MRREGTLIYLGTGHVREALVTQTHAEDGQLLCLAK
jgi:hypothetical protein